MWFTLADPHYLFPGTSSPSSSRLPTGRLCQQSPSNTVLLLTLRRVYFSSWNNSVHSLPETPRMTRLWDQPSPRSFLLWEAVPNGFTHKVLMTQRAAALPEPRLWCSWDEQFIWLLNNNVTKCYEVAVINLVADFPLSIHTHKHAVRAYIPAQDAVYHQKHQAGDKSKQELCRIRAECQSSA